jgi:hydrogenase maturation protease
MPVTDQSRSGAARQLPDLVVPGLTVPDPSIANQKQYVLPEQDTGRVLVGGIGVPWLRDLDYGTQWVNRVSEHDWPDHVIVEDMSYAAHRVLHRLQEVRPNKVVLVGCMPRREDPAGTIRRYKLDLTPPEDDEVQDRLSEAAMGIIDLDHTLAVVRYYGEFPADTVVIEIEPEDDSFGLGFSDVVEATVDEVLALVRSEI